MSSFDFGIKNLPVHLDAVNKKLKALAPENINGIGRFLASSGKRLRPSLVMAVAHHSGRDIDGRVIDVAAAVELVHLASLVHDDIMDNGELRWGEPTINSTEGIDSAILAGDYLLAKGCGLATSVSAEAGIVLSETIACLCEGQALELRDRFNLERTPESLALTAKNKTSSLFTASVELGGMVAGLNSKQLETLKRFAENFGIAYQYMDDVGDVSNDVLEGNYTLPVILSLHGPNKVKLQKLLRKSEIVTSQVLEILQEDQSLNRTLKVAEGYERKARKELQRFDKTELSQALSGLLDTK